MKKYFLMIILASSICTNIKADTICSSIDAPGTYIYGGSIEASPTDDNDTIVCVTSSDVTVDLGGHVFTQTNAVPGLDGIRVGPGLKNITIINGEIRGLTGNGILIGEGCEDVTIKNMKIKSCNATGINFAGTIANQIKDGTISECTVSSCTGANGNPAYGIRLTQCSDIDITNCSATGNDAITTNNGFGMSFEWCDGCKIINCDIESNGGNALGAGISLNQSAWCSIDYCRIVSTIARDSGPSSKAVGILLSQCSHCSASECTVKHTANLASQSHGFQSIDGINNTFFLCNSENNLGSTFASGITLRGTENKSGIFECKCRVNDGGISGTGYGIFIDGAQNCDVWYNHLIGNQGASGYGLLDNTTDTTNLIAGNLAFSNTTTGFSVTRTIGSFPVLSANVGDFSTIDSTSDYMNINFSS
jgi:hypothetical protein